MSLLLAMSMPLQLTPSGHVHAPPPVVSWSGVKSPSEASPRNQFSSRRLSSSIFFFSSRRFPSILQFSSNFSRKLSRTIQSCHSPGSDDDNIMLMLMDDAHRAVLERCAESILCDLDYNLVCANLILTGVLNWKLHHIINARPTNRLKARALMAILPRRGPLAFQRFLAALDAADYVWLIEEINRALYDVYTEAV